MNPDASRSSKRRRALAACVPIAGLLVLWCGAARSGELADCGPARAHTIARNAEVRVYVVSGKIDRSYGKTKIYEKTKTIYACLGGRAGKVALAPTDHVVDHVELAGTIVAYADTTIFIDTSDTDIDVVDITSGRRVTTVPDAGGFSVLSFQYVVDLVATRRGSVAWTIHAQSRNKKATYAVYRAEVSRPSRLLDKSRVIDPRSLRISGHTVSWVSAGRRRSAQLP